MREKDCNLSESNTKCWLLGSFNAFAKRRFSASTIEILPQSTCRMDPMKLITSHLGGGKHISLNGGMVVCWDNKKIECMLIVNTYRRK